MDWGGFKPSSAWDFGEMSREEGGLGVQQSGGVFSVDLKLGGSMAKKMMQEPNGSASSSGPSKRAERGVSGPQNVSCSVEGCTADLGSCRDYYRRHRVCERHSKTPVVTVRGRQLRFCQQCSRFHSLEEFDEQKRSCRKRLDGHNRRRRKPQRKPYQMSPGSFLSNLQGYSVVPTHQGVYNGHSLSVSNGARLVQFRGSPTDTAAASSAGAVPTWPAKQEHNPHFTNQQTVIPNVDAGGAKTFPFLLPNDHAAGRSNQTVPEVEMCRWLDNDHNVYSGELPHSVVNNSKFALSLLSTRVVSPNRPMDGGVQFDGPRSSNTGGIPYCEAFHVAPDDMLEKGASHVLLPFSWK